MIGNRLQQLRKAKGETQEQVAESLNLSRQSYGYYETDQREPNLETLILLSKHFNTSVDFLLGIEAKEEIVVNSLLLEARLTKEEQMIFRILLDKISA